MIVASTQVPAALNRAFLHSFLAKQDGKFVSVEFVKLDGSLRTMNGRLGVRKHLVGGSNTVMASDRPYLTIYDMKSKGYRTLNLATARKVRAEKQVFEIVD